jgi:mono/diheme cytochrome c family protein
MSPLLFLLLACGGESPTPAPTPAAPIVTAPAPDAVGPDGPTSIAIPAIASIATDAPSVAAGDAVFAARGCGACHQFGTKLVGPDLAGVTQRRSTPWIERMVTDPEVMTKQDPVAKGLFRTHMVQMTKQGVTPAELPNLLAFLHSKGG